MLYRDSRLEINVDGSGVKASLPINRGLAKVTFILGLHGSREDFPMTLREEYSDADIILHEQIGWSKESQECMDKHAEGIDTPVAQDPFGINERKKQLLFGTGVKNSFWDLPDGHMSTPEMFNYFGQFTTGPQVVDIDHHVGMVLRRDKMAARTIGRTIDAVHLDEERPDPLVLVIAGMAHVALANAYRQVDSSTRIMTPNPPADSVPDEVAWVLDKLSR